MNLRRTFAISRRIANGFRRDHRTLALMFVAPIVILGLLGWVISDQTPSPSRLAIVNQAGPPGEIARNVIGAGATEGGLELDSTITDEAAAREALADERLDLVIVLPAGLLDEVAAGVAPTIP